MSRTGYSLLNPGPTNSDTNWSKQADTFGLRPEMSHRPDRIEFAAAAAHEFARTGLQRRGSPLTLPPATC
jgi:hypothetical protein